MITHILTPNINAYGICIVITLSLGCSNIASHIHSRWFALSKVNPMKIHWVVKLIISFYGLLLFSDNYYLFHFDLYTLFYILLAACLGFMCFNIEMKIARYFYRRDCYTTAQRYAYTSADYGYAVDIAKSAKQSKVNIQNIHAHHVALNSELNSYELFDVLMVAIFEELIFRGILLKLCMLISSIYMLIAALLCTLIFFAGCHVIYGKGQFCIKFVLGLLCLIMTLISRSIFPAVVTHATFNYFAYRYHVYSNEARSRCLYVY